jgi:hypothetical protein
MSVHIAWLAATGGHEPTRPGWDCTAGCGSWPCAPAKVHLAEHLRPPKLLKAMIVAYGMARVELDGAELRGLWRRFVEWGQP